jgi:hypothetical protein
LRQAKRQFIRAPGLPFGRMVLQLFDISELITPFSLFSSRLSQRSYCGRTANVWRHLIVWTGLERYLLQYADWICIGPFFDTRHRYLFTLDSGMSDRDCREARWSSKQATLLQRASTF